MRLDFLRGHGGLSADPSRKQYDSARGVPAKIR
jgi:hypothetical protein